MTAKFKVQKTEEESKDPEKPALNFGQLLSMGLPKETNGASTAPINPLFAAMQKNAAKNLLNLNKDGGDNNAIKEMLKKKMAEQQKNAIRDALSTAIR